MGIVPSPGDKESASIRIEGANMVRLENGVTTSTSGTIHAEYRQPPLRYLPSGYPANLFFPSATLSIYLRNPSTGAERLVHTGPMTLQPVMTAAVVPPTNKAPSGVTWRFATKISDPQDRTSPSLAAGSYRAEVVFYHQDMSMEAMAVGWKPALVEVAGAAMNFTANNFFVAPLADARGEIKVSSVVTPKRGATAAQVAALRQAAANEYAKAAAACRNYLAAGARPETGAPARRPWLFSETSTNNGDYSSIFFHLFDGESFAESKTSPETSLTRTVAGANVSGSLQGGTYKITATTNITLHRR